MKHKIKESNNNLDLKTTLEWLIEDYRFCRTYISLVNNAIITDRKKYESTLNFHLKKISEICESCNIKLVTYDGKPYIEGLPVIHLNIEDFEKDDKLIIVQTIEPAFLSIDGKILKSGTVILEKIECNPTEQDTTQNN